MLSPLRHSITQAVDWPGCTRHVCVLPKPCVKSDMSQVSLPLLPGNGKRGGQADAQRSSTIAREPTCIQDYSVFAITIIIGPAWVDGQEAAADAAA
jgi:hypothetical protein